MTPAEEHDLPGGNVASVVRRIGDTVRKPAGPWTPSVDVLLRDLTASGFTGSPQSYGCDEQGRHVLEYVPGPMADQAGPLSADDLYRVGALIRQLHDATAKFRPPADARWQVVIRPDRDDLICHHDLAPWNLVLGSDRWVFIDWDGAGPGSRLWDLGYAVTGFVPMTPAGDPVADAPRVRAIADGYQLTRAQRADLPRLIEAHTRAMFELLRRGGQTGQAPWARLWAEGHGDYWGPAADYIGAHLDDWSRALR